MTPGTAVFALSGVSGCTGDSPDPTDPTPKEWQGDAPHFQIAGQVGDRDLTLAMDEAAASDPATVACRREYEVADTSDTGKTGRLMELDISWAQEVDGAYRLYRLEFKNHDFSGPQPNDGMLRVVPRDDFSDPPEDALWLEIEWEYVEAGNLYQYEEAAKSGRFDLGAITGEPGPDGLVIPDGEGSFGGFFDAAWGPSERLLGSFMVVCEESDVQLSD